MTAAGPSCSASPAAPGDAATATACSTPRSRVPRPRASPRDRLVVAEAGIGWCRGCNSCCATARCIQRDGMDDVYPLLDAADGLRGRRRPSSSPACRRSSRRSSTAASRTGSRRYVLGEPRPASKRPGGVLIAAGGGDPFGTECVDIPIRSAFGVLSVEVLGTVLAEPVDAPRDILGKPDILDVCRRSGRRYRPTGGLQNLTDGRGRYAPVTCDFRAAAFCDRSWRRACLPPTRLALASELPLRRALATSSPSARGDEWGQTGSFALGGVMSVRRTGPGRRTSAYSIVAAVLAAALVTGTVTGFAWAPRGVTVVVDGRAIHVHDAGGHRRRAPGRATGAGRPRGSGQPSLAADLPAGGTVVVRRDAVPVTLELAGRPLDMRVVGADRRRRPGRGGRSIPSAGSA